MTFSGIKVFDMKVCDDCYQLIEWRGSRGRKSAWGKCRCPGQWGWGYQVK